MLKRLRPVAYRGLLASVGTYLKFQVLTKIVTAIAVAPILGLATAALVRADGQAVVTQATLVPFLLSWRGAGFAVVLAIMVLAGFVLELAGFIIISARAMHGLPEARYRDILRLGFSRCRNLLGLALPLVLFYMAVIVPLTGSGMTIGQLTKIKVPNFVMAVVAESGGLLAAYAAVLALLAVVGVLLSFTFHFVVLADQPVTTAVANSVRLIWRNHRRYGRLVAEVGSAALVVSLLALGWLIAMYLLVVTLGADTAWERVMFMALWLIQQSVVGLFTFLLAPIQVHALTRPLLRPLRLRTTSSRPWRRSFLRTPEPVQVIAHRAGGFGTPENSMSGLTFAVANTGLGRRGGRPADQGRPLRPQPRRHIPPSCGGEAARVGDDARRGRASRHRS